MRIVLERINKAPVIRFKDRPVQAQDQIQF